MSLHRHEYTYLFFFSIQKVLMTTCRRILVEHFVGNFLRNFCYETFGKFLCGTSEKYYVGVQMKKEEITTFS